jgi:hypothetical protein
VLPERDVVLEEFNMRVANNPEARLTELESWRRCISIIPMAAQVIGWHQEIESSTAKMRWRSTDALCAQQRDRDHCRRCRRRMFARWRSGRSAKSPPASDSGERAAAGTSPGGAHP